MTLAFFNLILGALILVKLGDAYPAIPLDEAIENAARQFPQEVATIEAIENLNEKSARQFGFLNILSTLNKLGNLGDLSSILNNAVLNGNTNNNNGVPNTTPRLNGRPGLGFIPDIPKGIDRILTGVAAGNLEQILEGSFVFAPTGVQKVAGSVLDRVFISSTPVPVPGGAGSKTSGVPLKQVTTAVPSQQPTTLSSAEAQKQLQQIIKQQIQLQQLQAQLQQHAIRLQNSQQKQASKTAGEAPPESAAIDRVAEMPVVSTTQVSAAEPTTEQAPDMWVRENA